jgi:hypothetical protein
VIITFDCYKGVEILKERIRKKEIEWYKIIFEDPKITPTLSEELKENKRDTSQQKGKNKDFVWITLWDLPLNYSKQEIRRLLKYFGSSDEIRTKRLKYSQCAEVKISLKGEEQERKLKANWALGLENGKLARLAIGNSSTNNLKEREKYRATLMNIPSTAQEALLLRTLQFTGAKTVYIPYNTNRNPSRIAKVFFSSKEDMESAQRRNIFYFNTKLVWKENLTSNRNEQGRDKFQRISRKNSIVKENTEESVIHKEVNRNPRESKKNQGHTQENNNFSLKMKLLQLQEEICNLSVQVERIEQISESKEVKGKLESRPNRS